MITGGQIQVSFGSIGFTLYADGRSISLSLPKGWQSKWTEGDAIKLLSGLGETAKNLMKQHLWAGAYSEYPLQTCEGEIGLENH